MYVNCEDMSTYVFLWVAIVCLNYCLQYVMPFKMCVTRNELYMNSLSARLALCKYEMVTTWGESNPSGI